MERRAKVDLFERIRREYEFGVGTIWAVAQKLGSVKAKYILGQIDSECAYFHWLDSPSSPLRL